MLQNMSLGAVLSDKYPDGTEKPIAYASTALIKHKIKYLQVHEEGASVIFALKNLINIY